jgi:DNA-binding transcriptional regulator YdaS (Cro superfamily)
MTDADRLNAAASAVLGEHWRRPLARLLAVDYRRVRRWGSGALPVPPAVLAVLTHLCRARQEIRPRTELDARQRETRA